MKRAIIFIAAMLYVSKTVPQSTFPVNPSFSIANTSVADTSVWLAMQNPACLSYSDYPGIILSTRSSYYLTFPQTESLTLTYPVLDIFNTAISLQYSGYSVWHNIISSLTFSRSFSDKFSLGLEFSLYSNYAYSTGKYYNALLANAGFVLPVGKKILIGFHDYNIFNTSLQTGIVHYPLPSFLSLGLSWQLYPALCWRIQLEKEAGGNYRFSSGIDYYAGQYFVFQTGFYGFKYLIPCLGIGFQKEKMQVRMMSEIHPLLGLIINAGVQYKLL